jgi:hypothetical protein
MQAVFFPLESDLTYIWAPTGGTIGATATPHQFLVNEFAIRTAVGWRISSVIPVPAQ